MATPTSLPATFVAGNVLTAAEMNALRGAFRIQQVVSTTKTDTFTTTAASFTDVTGLSVSITPSATSSKILVVCMIGASGAPGTASAKIQLVRDSTAIAIGDSASSRTRATQGSLHSGANTPDSVAIVFLDSPNTTSATTYKIQGFTASGQFFGVNRGETDTDAVGTVRSASTITVMEVSA